MQFPWVLNSFEERPPCHALLTSHFREQNGTYVHPNLEVDFRLFWRVIDLRQDRGYMMAKLRGMRLKPGQAPRIYTSLGSTAK